MKKIHAYMFIDALGWNIVSRHGFALDALPHRRKVEMQFGYSAAAVPTILSGEQPEKHGHFSFFYYDPKNSPFRKFRYMKFLCGAGLHPKCFFNRGRVRRHISRLVAKLNGYTGYFSLYSVPFEKLPYFDYCEKHDIFASGGLAPVENLRDVLEKSGLRWHMSDWRKSENENVKSAIDTLKGGQTDFAFIYSGDFDSFMHDNVFDDAAVHERLQRYEGIVSGIISALKQSGREYEFTVISDHGMTPNVATLDLMKKVGELKLKFGKDYVPFYDSTMLRLWYLDDGAKAKLRERLSKPDCRGRFVTDAEKEQYGIKFPGDKFGNDIFLMDDGVQIEPCDLGAKAMSGMHGYSPSNIDSYASFLSTASPRFEPKHVKDFFALMKADILEGGSAGA